MSQTGRLTKGVSVPTPITVPIRAKTARRPWSAVVSNTFFATLPFPVIQAATHNLVSFGLKALTVGKAPKTMR